MKKIILYLLLVTINLEANNSQFLNNIVEANNNLYNTISTLDEETENKFYEEFNNSKTISELNITLNKYFKQDETKVILVNLESLLNNISEFSKSSTPNDDLLDFYISRNNTNSESDRAPCKDDVGYMNCFQKTKAATIAFFQNNWGSSMSNFGTAGATLGGVISLFFSGADLGASMGIGGLIGSSYGFLSVLHDTYETYTKRVVNCYDLHCLGIDLGGPISDDEGYGGGGPGGGYNNNKFKYIKIK